MRNIIFLMLVLGMTSTANAALTLVVGDGTIFTDPGSEITVGINDTIWIGINDSVGVMYEADIGQYSQYGFSGSAEWTGNNAVYSPPAISTAPGWSCVNEHLWLVSLFDPDATDIPLPGVGCALQFRALDPGQVKVYLNAKPGGSDDDLTVYIVPEPGTVFLFGLAGVGLLRRHRRYRKR